MMPDFIGEGIATEQELDSLYAQTIEALEALELRNMLRGEEDKMRSEEHTSELQSLQ